MPRLEVDRSYRVEIGQADLSIIEARGFNLLLLIDKMVRLSEAGDEQEVHWIKGTTDTGTPFEGWMEDDELDQNDEVLYTVGEWIVEEVGLRIDGTYYPK